jgi:hypothetical protein
MASALAIASRRGLAFWRLVLWRLTMSGQPWFISPWGWLRKYYGRMAQRYFSGEGVSRQWRRLLHGAFVIRIFLALSLQISPARRLDADGAAFRSFSPLESSRAPCTFIRAAASPVSTLAMNRRLRRLAGVRTDHLLLPSIPLRCRASSHRPLLGDALVPFRKPRRSARCASHSAARGSLGNSRPGGVRTFFSLRPCAFAPA